MRAKSVLSLSVCLWLTTAAVSAATFEHTSWFDFSPGRVDSTVVTIGGSVLVDSHGYVVYSLTGDARPWLKPFAGSVWETESPLLDSGWSELLRLDAASSPRRHEAVVVATGESGQSMAQVWDGTRAHSPIQLGPGAATPGNPHIAVAYESLSGSALVVYHDGPGSPSYVVWDGTSWSQPLSVGLPAVEEPGNILLAADPGSDRVLLALVESGPALAGNAHAAVWDGSAWTDQQTLQADGSAGLRGIAARFMAQSGRALVSWVDGSSVGRFRVWDGSWGPEQTLPSTGNRPPQLLTLAAEADSNRLALTAITAPGGWRSALALVWDGSVWEPTWFELDSQLETFYRPLAAAAFEPSSDRIVTAYQPRTTTWVHSRTHTALDGWSAPLASGGASVDLASIDFEADPSSREIVLFWADATNLQTGTQFWVPNIFNNPEAHGSPLDADARSVVFRYCRHAPVYESASIDAGAAGSVWGELDWTATPTGALRFQVAVSDTDPPGAFVGPDGSADSYFAVSAGSPLPLGSRGRYLRYRVEFPAGDLQGTTLESVRVTTGPPPGGVVVASKPHPAPPRPQAVVSADMNDDGLADIVVLHPQDAQVSVSLGLGDGRYAVPRHASIKDGGSSLAAADLDADGRTDLLVVGNSQQSQFGWAQVLSGDGAGGLEPLQSFATGAAPSQLVLLDFDYDGLSDAAYSDPVLQGIVLLAGDGSAGFTELGFVATGSAPIGLAAGDLNGDMGTDLVCSLPDVGLLAVALADDSGGFQTASAFAAGSSPLGVALGDVDGDGRLDAIAADPQADQALVLLGDGLGGLSAAAGFAAGGGPIAVALLEADGDCHLDVALANQLSGDVSLLLGDGAGGLQPPASFSVGGAPSSLTAFDVEGDGRGDLASAVPQTDTVQVLHNQGAALLGIELLAHEPGCNGALVRLQGLAGQLDAQDFRWDFGDGSPPLTVPDLGTAVEHIYTAAGRVEVTLEAQTGSVCAARANPLPLEVRGATSVNAPAELLVCLDGGGNADPLLLDGAAWTDPDPVASGALCSWQAEAGALSPLPGCQASLQLSESERGQWQAVTLTVDDQQGCLTQGVTRVFVDAPVSEPVAGVMLSKAADGGVVVSYQPSAASGHALTRAASPELLEAAAPVAESSQPGSFLDTPPAGRWFYQVRATSACE